MGLKGQWTEKADSWLWKEEAKQRHTGLPISFLHIIVARDLEEEMLWSGGSDGPLMEQL